MSKHLSVVFVIIALIVKSELLSLTLLLFAGVWGVLKLLDEMGKGGY